MSRGNLPFFVFRRSLEVFFMLYVLGGIFLMGWGGADVPAARYFL